MTTPIFTQEEYQLLLKAIMLGMQHLKTDEKPQAIMLANKLKALSES